MPSFDGVVCFGGADWWYHNRGHYDLQMMRELSAHGPVLYVNSIGIRVPSPGEGSVFVRRVARKLASFRRGFVRVHERFGVSSPIVVPGRFGMQISKWLLSPQVQLAATRMHIRKPLVWVTCPPGVEALDGLRPAGVVYERTDRWESFPEADPSLIRSYHRRLRERADLTLYCSTLLFEEERNTCRNAAYVDHGVDFDFFAAGAGSEEPDDLRDIRRPRAGFVGAIDDATFDPGLFVDTARRLPDVQFLLVGPCTFPPGWVHLDNVHLLGQKPYASVPSYLAACDVLLMPWNQSEWIQACNPIKLKEYLAAGKPIVSSPFHELRRYPGLVQIANGAAAFAAEIQTALNRPGDSAIRRERVRHETWAAKGEQVLRLLAERGIAAA